MAKRTPCLRGEVLEADTTGPAVARVGTIQLNWVSPAYCPKLDNFFLLSGGPESSPVGVGVGHLPKAMEEIPRQQQEREGRALAVSNLQVGATREVEAVPVAG